MVPIKFYKNILSTLIILLTIFIAINIILLQSNNFTQDNYNITTEKKDELVTSSFLSKTVYNNELHKNAPISNKLWNYIINNTPGLSKKDKSKYQRLYLHSIFFAYKNSDISNDTGVYSLFTIDKSSQNTYYISFRGTNDSSDRATDLKLFLSRPSNDFKDVEEHINYYYNKEIKHSKTPPKIIFSGHSLGGALAQHAAVYAVKKLKIHPSTISLYTFNSPTFLHNILENKGMQLNYSKNLILTKQFIPGIFTKDLIGSFLSSYHLGSSKNNVLYLDKDSGNIYLQNELNTKFEYLLMLKNPFLYFLIVLNIQFTTLFYLHSIDDIYITLSESQ